ncbi:hypothetical protein DICSQDRAFT_139943 [Dichomitus squalens LYAD-421 SS1]|uniref:Uncharacterized protein n=1 Tax=Dichomitus squalens (strain LYAD-421) TaxID=732165 RepID=R7SP75_DICSQ|nr:uncharacterized protein DICSQDRAFT_139943 [Dichomitus squalens LYAD-421 SS1]EJF57901.1 hypothetical protein DICSQDRAFT_139943 [Dichomitus squalens LYAD-421 SS1]
MNRCIAHPLCTNSAAASEDVPTYARERFGNQKVISSGLGLVRSSYGPKANAEAEARPTRYRTRSLVPLTSTQCERRRICPVSSRRISRRIRLPSTSISMYTYIYTTALIRLMIRLGHSMATSGSTSQSSRTTSSACSRSAT